MKALNWKPLEKNTLRGFFDLDLDSGLQILGMTLHTKEGKTWVAFPSRPYQEDGQTKYASILKIPDDIKWRKFQTLVKAAVAAIRGNGEEEPGEVPF